MIEVTDKVAPWIWYHDLFLRLIHRGKPAPDSGQSLISTLYSSHVHSWESVFWTSISSLTLLVAASGPRKHTPFILDGVKQPNMEFLVLGNRADKPVYVHSLC